MKHCIILSLVCIALCKCRQNYDISNIGFGSKLYHQVGKQFANKNFAMSSFSLNTALAMVYMGAEGDTKDQMKRLLHYPEDKKMIQGFTRGLQFLNKQRQSFTLETANLICIDKQYTLLSEFKSTITRVFHGEVVKANFEDNEASASKINSWVEKKTRNKIQDVIDPDSLSQDTVMVLVNALYFKGLWAQPFKKTFTRKIDFFVTANNPVKVDMMFQNGHFRIKYLEELDAQIIKLPFVGEIMRMYVLLPNKKDGLGQVERQFSKMSKEKLHELFRMDNVNPRLVGLNMPRFKLETTLDLLPILNKMGFGKVFRTLNIGKMIKNKLTRPVYISDVVQKVFIEINEEGAEAAAATAIQVMARMIPPQFNCNHPFMFFLEHREEGDTAGTSLFQGRVINPME